MRQFLKPTQICDVYFLQNGAWNSVRNQSKYFLCCWSSPRKSSASVTRLKDFFLVELNSNAFANEKLTSKHLFVLTVEMSTRQWAKVNTSICLICFHITHTDWTKSSSRSHVHLCDVVPCDHTSWQTPIAGQLTSFRIFEPLEKNFEIGFWFSQVFLFGRENRGQFGKYCESSLGLGKNPQNTKKISLDRLSCLFKWVGWVLAWQPAAAALSNHRFGHLVAPNAPLLLGKSWLKKQW